LQRLLGDKGRRGLSRGAALPPTAEAKAITSSGHSSHSHGQLVDSTSLGAVGGTAAEGALLESQQRVLKALERLQEQNTSLEIRVASLQSQVGERTIATSPGLRGSLPKPAPNPLTLTHAHTCTHTQMHAHTYTHAHTHAHVRAHTCTHAHARAHKHIHATHRSSSVAHHNSNPENPTVIRAPQRRHSS